mmetsp:Transcript_4422/g.10026  ORF Transcript_4422/g.10026 Transcript_4422/m.10026 type:complete len:96 (-) Transcript_4422:310-597(-)
MKIVMVVWCVINGADPSLFLAARVLARVVPIIVWNLLYCMAIRMIIAPVPKSVGDALVIAIAIGNALEIWSVFRGAEPNLFLVVAAKGLVVMDTV